jgi:hypothetical protein
LPSGLPWIVAPRSVAIACALGLVVSPHAWVYDATLLLPALSLLALDASRSGWPTRAIRAFVVAYALAILWPFGWIVGLTPIVLVVVGVALALVPGGAARRVLALGESGAS